MAKRGRKPKEKKNYFSEVEESAVTEYIALSRASSGNTCKILETIFSCTPEVLAVLSSGKTQSELNAIANDMEVIDSEARKTIKELENEIDAIESRKNAIFNTILHPAFVKMIESIIRRYKLYVPDEEFVQTFNDTISYLMTKIHNFKPDKGKKAYSYCGTVCRNYLTYKNIQFTKEQLRSTSFDDNIDEITDSAQYTIFTDDYSRLANKLIKRSSIEIQNMLTNPEENQLTSNEIKVGMALTELLNNWEDLLMPDLTKTSNEEDFSGWSNKMQKSKVLFFLREETMMSTKEVRDNMKKFKSIYAEVKKSILEED